MPSISRRRAAAYALAVLLLLAMGGRFALGGGEDRARPETVRAPAGTLAAETAPVRTLLVHVVGAVRRPGLYRLRDGSRTNDAIRKAGGAKPKAALELVNLASPFADGQQVVVPARGDPGATTAAADGVPGSAPGGKIHLNSATLEQLDTLPGIGPVTAQKILAYRTEHGAFQTVEELDAVPGIGPARLEDLKALVDL
ncbi:ComEA family DNA-binding protein [soil metagenome]